MRPKYLAGLAPLLAMVAFMVAPALAQAQPHWFSNNVLLPETPPEAKTPVTTKGTLTLEDKEIAAPLVVRLTCKVVDAGNVWNPAGGGAGKDEITAFEEEVAGKSCSAVVLPEPPGGKCEKAEFVANGLPWSTKLLAGLPIRDEVEGISVTVTLTNCPAIGTPPALTYTGPLTPKIVNGVEGVSNSFAEFDQPGSGSLTSGAGTKGSITGNDEIEGPIGDEFISAE